MKRGKRKKLRDNAKLRKHWEKAVQRHHMTPVSKGGSSKGSNLLLIHKLRHVGWHWFAGNRTLEEVIYLLSRVHRAKKRCNRPCPICQLTME